MWQNTDQKSRGQPQKYNKGTGLRTNMVMTIMIRLSFKNITPTMGQYSNIRVYKIFEEINMTV